MAKENLGNELKGLGADVSKAFVGMKNSHEFQKLKKDLVVSFKFVTASLTKALKTAKDSPETGRIKSRLKKVAQIGKKEGLIKARQAEVVAAKKIRQARAAIKKMSRKTKS